jgi:hypothetical protein
VGDTASQDVAACVQLARRYSQDRVYDSAAAHDRSDAVKRARRKLRMGVGGVVGAIGDVAASVGLGEAVGRRAANTIERAAEPLAEDSSDYTRRKRELRAELASLLDAAQALCEVDPLDAARDASRLCRKAVPAEAIWQLERLTAYQQRSPSPAEHTA